jgi:hypothetical protein
MADSIFTTEQFTCAGCGIDYAATREERPEKCVGHFKCGVCHAEVHAWSGNHSFFGWEPIRTRSPVFGKKKQQASVLSRDLFAEPQPHSSPSEG